MEEKYYWYESGDTTSYFERNRNKEFLEELDNIKKSDPKEKYVPKVSNSYKGFFTNFFRKATIQEEIIYENIDIDGYISIAKFIEMLCNFLGYIYIESNKIVEKYQKISRMDEKRFFPCFDGNKFCIAYFNYRPDEKYENKDYYRAEKKIKVDFYKFPYLSDGLQSEYELIKEDIFRLIPYLKVYLKILDIGKNQNIALSSKTCLKVNFDSENDVFRNEYPIVKLEISDIAMVEYSKKDNNEKYLSYSEDIGLLEILEKSKKKLFYSCYIPDDLEIVKLLKNLELEETL